MEINKLKTLFDDNMSHDCYFLTYLANKRKKKKRSESHGVPNLVGKVSINRKVA